MLSAGEIAQMRTVVETETLAGTAVISRFTSAPDGQGGQTDTYAPAGTVSCHVSPLGGDEALLAGRVASESQWVATFPAGTDIQVADQFVESGNTFQIDSVRAPRTWELATRVYAHRIT